MSGRAESKTPAARENPPAAELFAFDEAAAPAAHQVRICRVVPVAPIRPEDVLELAGRVRWPGDPPIARALAAALAEGGIPIPHEPDGNGRGRWHPVPYQGIDGQVGQFDVLVGTVDFLEDAGIPVVESVRPTLAECEARGWWPVLVGACRRRQGLQPAHRSLIGVLVIEPQPSAARPDRLPRGGPGGREPSVPARALLRVTALCHQLWSRIAGLVFRRWRRVAAAALASALAGLWCSALTVRADELALVQRFGRLAAVLGPGLHIRPAWPFEHVTRLRPGPARTVELAPLVSARADPNDAPISELMLTGDLWPPDTSATQTTAGPTDPGPFRSVSQLLRVRARVQYSVADPKAFVFAVRRGDDLVRTAAESVLRALVASRSMSACIGPGRADIAARAGRLLQERMDILGCGIAVDAFILDELEPSNRSEKLQDTRAGIDQIEKGIQGLTEADRQITEARRTALNIIAAAQKDRDRRIRSAQTLLEQVQAHQAAFIRDPQTTRRQLLIDLISRTPNVLPVLRELLQTTAAGGRPPETQKGGQP